MTHSATARKLVLASVGLMLATGACVTPASAQQQPATPKVDAAQAPRQAPVGHRQPRAADVPPPQQQQQTDSTAGQGGRDKTLDQRLQICRGC
jgi:hypothetical protein